MESPIERDRRLGMDRPIARRDFLNGVAVGVGGALVAGATPGLGRFVWAAGGGDDGTAANYVGTLGGHSQRAMDVMHAIRDGTFWKSAPEVVDTAESYDVVVVGGGVSGLAAAWLYRSERPDARILVIENNEEFGGHARLNEFEMSDGSTLIGYGGSQSMQTPSYWSQLVTHVIAEVGIDVSKFETFYDGAWSEDRGLTGAVFFPESAFGSDVLVRTDGPAADWVPKTPLNDRAKADLIELLDSPPDYLAGMTRDEKLELLSRTTYADFLTEICGYDAQLVDFFQHSTEGYFGMGIDGTTVLDAWGNYNPGFDGMDLGDTPYPTMSPSGRLALTDPDPYIYHFPDGNAGVARSLVRNLVPAALPGSTMEDLVTTAVVPSELDVEDNAVRIRLGSSVVRVAHEGAVDDAATVAVTYVAGSELRKVTAGHVVLACWHRVIPYLTEEIPEAQVTALNDQIKVPLLYTNVAIRNWEAFAELGIDGFETVGGFWNGASIDFPVSMGDYRFADQPTDPVVLHLSKVPLTGDPEMSAREQAQAGRQFLVNLTFEEMEREIREMLSAALGPPGSTRSRTSRASPSTGGATGTPWSTCGRGTSSGPPGHCRSRSRGPAMAGWRSPTPTPVPMPMCTRRSIRRVAPSPNCSAPSATRRGPTSPARRPTTSGSEHPLVAGVTSPDRRCPASRRQISNLRTSQALAGHRRGCIRRRPVRGVAANVDRPGWSDDGGRADGVREPPVLRRRRDAAARRRGGQGAWQARRNPRRLDPPATRPGRQSLLVGCVVRFWSVVVLAVES
jgi:spermidine dehydrogenase